MREGQRLARIGAILSLAIVAVLAGIMIWSKNYVALLFVLPATSAGFIALTAKSALSLGIAAALLSVNVFLLLIGWAGVLFGPSLVLFILAASDSGSDTGR